MAFIGVDSTDARLIIKRAESTSAKFANVSSTTTKKASPTTTTTKKLTTTTTTTVKKAVASVTKKTSTAVANSSSVVDSASTNTQSPPPMGINPHTTSDLLASSTPTTQKDTASANSSSGISGSAIGGIVASIIIIIAGVIAYLFLRRKKTNKMNSSSKSKPDPFTMGFGSNQAFQTSQMQQNTLQENTTAYQHQYGTVPPVTSPSPYNNNNSNTNVSQFHDAESHITIGSMVSASVPPQQAEQQTRAYQYQPQLNQQYQPQSNQQYQPNTIYQQDQLETRSSNAPVPLPPPTHAGSIGVFYVAATYTPTLSDEIDIQTGDHVEILVEYDDGWCQGINLSRGNSKGVFPKHCIEYPTTSNSQADKANRVSSMYIA